MTRVGFVIQEQGDGWLGGSNYRRNLLNATLANADRRIEPVIIASPAHSPGVSTGFPGIEVAPSALARTEHPARRAGQVARRVVGRDIALEWLMRRHHIDVLSHSFPTGRRSPAKSINWIPDFQHVHLPEFFSEAECRARDAYYHRLIEDSTRVIVSSDDAARDFARFAPHATHKARVLHFVADVRATEDAPALEQLRSRFGISSAYFHLPNQFWAHKNHTLVIEALGILKDRGIDALVLATGNTSDYRNPGHFERLMARASELGVAERFRVLGVVSLPELRSLMIHALALINPSRFEGWSTTVEEAKSLGLPIILSDIPVHVEQAPALGRYFKSGSAQELAEAMAACLGNPDPLAASRAREAAMGALPGRIRAFGLKYQQIVLEALGG